MVHDRRRVQRLGAMAGIALVLWAAATLVPAGMTTPALAAGTSTTTTFLYTGGNQSWTVPAGVTQATFAVYGAAGAKSAFNGGLGGFALATAEVTPGEVITIVVGGQGQESSAITCVLLTDVGLPGPGGFNGGGAGGDGCSSAGGGGASDIRRGGTDLDDRFLVAGGGGGGAGNLICNGAGGGGGLTGGSATANILCSGGGVGGNQNGTTGSGVAGVGSVGADQDGLSGSGGGGGGGWWGGSGGQPSLGGGGGSGFGPLGTTFAGGVRGGDGLVTVTFGDAPQITDLLPSSGTAGTTTTVVGHNFDPAPGGTTVTFGGVAATVTSCTETDCTVTVPPGTGTVGVQVSANGEQSLDTPDAAFTYLPRPSITSITPDGAAPGEVVTVQGDGFVVDAGFTTMQFGSSTVPADCTTRFVCTATVPGLAVGSTLLRAVTLAGSSDPAAFAILPAVTLVAPDRGPAAGGTVVTLTGTGFSTAAGATSVAFGATPAVAVGCSSTTTCTAVSPAGTGTVDISVTVAGLQSVAAAGDRFTYETELVEEPPTTTTLPPTSVTTTSTPAPTSTPTTNPPPPAAVAVVAAPRLAG